MAPQVVHPSLAVKPDKHIPQVVNTSPAEAEQTNTARSSFQLTAEAEVVTRDKGRKEKSKGGGGKLKYFQMRVKPAV